MAGKSSVHAMPIHVISNRSEAAPWLGSLVYM